MSEVARNVTPTTPRWLGENWGFLMGTAEHNRVREWRVAITPDSEAQLLGLEPAFRGELNTHEREDLSDLSDDQLVAIFLGWHMEQLDVGFIDMTKHVWVECTSRAQLAAGQNFHQIELAKRRIAARGIHPRGAHVLTVDGIEANTLHLLTKRVRELKLFLEQMSRTSIRMGEPDENDATLLKLAGVPDQVILDASVYLYAFSFRQNPITAFPVNVVEEMNARALKRERQDADIPVIELPGCVLSLPDETARPKLRPRDRLAFTRARRINYNDPFWTDERIIEALDLGL